MYKTTVQPLVATLFANGKATCFAYGQTGSGKTHTMSPLPIRAAADLLQYLARPQWEDVSLFVSCFEIYGNKARAAGQSSGGQGRRGRRREPDRGEEGDVERSGQPRAFAGCGSTRPSAQPAHRPTACQVYDLLNSRKKLNILEDGKKQVCVVGLKVRRV